MRDTEYFRELRRALKRALTPLLPLSQIGQNGVRLLGVLFCQPVANPSDSHLGLVLTRQPRSTHFCLVGIGNRFGASSTRRYAEFYDQLLATTQELSQLHSHSVRKCMQAGQHNLQAFSDEQFAGFRELFTLCLLRNEDVLRDRIFALHFGRNESQVDAKFTQLGAAVSQSYRLLTCLFVARSLIFSNLRHSLRRLGGGSQRVRLNTEKKYGYRRYSGYEHCADARHRRYCIPPHDAIIYSKLLATKDGIPLTHSLIPLWTGRHFATPMQRPENAHG